MTYNKKKLIVKTTLIWLSIVLFGYGFWIALENGLVEFMWPILPATFGAWLYWSIYRLLEIKARHK